MVISQRSKNFHLNPKTLINPLRRKRNEVRYKTVLRINNSELHMKCSTYSKRNLQPYDTLNYITNEIILKIQFNFFFFFHFPLPASPFLFLGPKFTLFPLSSPFTLSLNFPFFVCNSLTSI